MSIIFGNQIFTTWFISYAMVAVFALVCYFLTPAENKK